MNTLIILNGKCNDYLHLKNLSLKADRIICADGGYNHALKAGIKPDIVMGDFDSSDKPDNINTIVYPAEKDLSDAEIAVNYAIENFGRDIVLTCALGGRLDHQLFNLYLLSRYNNVKINEADVMISYCDSYAEFKDFSNKNISILPLEESNISMSGFKYPLENADIKPGSTLTLSNIAMQDARLIVNSGKVLAIVCKTDI